MEYFYLMKLDREKIQLLYETTSEKQVGDPKIQLKEMSSYKLRGLTILTKRQEIRQALYV
jgi:hypothetical protein